MNKSNLLTIIFSVTASLLFAQLTGTKNIPGDYISLDAAIVDLNSQGVGAGGVVINLLSGNSQTAPSGGYSITASGSSAAPIILEGNNNTITAYSPQPAGSLNDGLFKIIGADYITIQGFILQENPANTGNSPSTNSMTEWGIALLRNSTTDGAQYNSILNNTISLDRNYDNTFGIYSSAAHSATTVQSVTNPASANGTNSNNKFYGNQISNVNQGITVTGSSSTYRDFGNDVGGSNPTTGNVITNSGKTAAWSAFGNNAFNSGYLIFLNYQMNSNISYNTLTSATILGGVQFRGIYQNELTFSGSCVNSITNNSVTITTNQLSSTNCKAIEYNTGTGNATARMDHNTVFNMAIGSNSNFTATGILCLGNPDIVSISFNTFIGNTIASTGGFTCINNSANANDSIKIDNNLFGTSTLSGISFTSLGNGLFRGIYNTAGAIGCTLSIIGNDFRTIDHPTGATGSHIYIENYAPNPNSKINENTFTSMNCLNTGGITFIYSNATHAANTIHYVNDNRIVGSYNRAYGNGDVYLYNAYGTSPASVTETNSGNNFSNISIPGTGKFYGWQTLDGSTFTPIGPSKILTNNTFENITAGSGGITVIQFGLANENPVLNAVTDNTVSNINCSGPINAIIVSTCGCYVANNTIHDLNGGEKVKALVLDAIDSGSVAEHNKIYNITTNANAVFGFFIHNFTSECRVSNNFVGNLYAPNADTANAVVGMFIHTTDLISFYYNTVYLDSGSTGTNFGTSGFYAGPNSKTLLKNNLVVNRTVANGTGKAVAFRRISPNVPAQYDTASDHNSFYSGLPSPSHLIYSDGVNDFQNIPTYSAYIAPADAYSITDNTTFLSIEGDSAQYLHVAAGAASALESAGTAIPGITTDYDTDVRPGPTGSVYGGGFAPDIGADEFDGQGPCSGTPSVGTASLPGSQCRGSMFVISVSGGSVGSGINYQWYFSSVAGGPYSPLFGAATPAFTTAPLYTDMYYMCVVTCAATGTSDTSAEVPAIVYGPVVSFQVGLDTICNSVTTISLVGSPAGGVFSGPGVDTAGFHPSVSGTGSKVITYTYTDSATSCVITASDTVYVDFCTSILSVDNNISIGPNPVNHELMVHTEQSGPLRISILNVLGMEILSSEAETSDFTINLQYLPSGLYYLQLTGGTEVAVVPFIKE